jgi:hypothetical protein
MINFLRNFSFANIAPNASNINACPDQVVGKIVNGVFNPYLKRADIVYVDNNNMVSVTNKLKNPVVIILESPHKNEFDPITKMALGPCMGVSGENFNSFFNSIFHLSSIYQNIQHAVCDVIFLNAIQYQCSLGLSLSGKNNLANKKVRDSNFLTCLNNINNNDFILRLQAIHPFAIINLCTKGLSNLQQKIDNICIQQGFVNYTTGYHPSTWKNKKYAKIN